MKAMEVNFNELNIKIQKMTGKHPNLLASAILTLKEENGGFFSISGFTIWKSKYGGYNVEVPSKKGFKYCLFEKTLWQRIKKEILKKYDYSTIPIIEDNN